MTNDLKLRRIEPELLDSLAPDDPRAIGSRRDLAWINALMFHGAIMAGFLKATGRKNSTRILEIGSGDGAFMLSVARRLAGIWTDVDLIMLDQVNLINDKRRSQFAALGWRVETITDDIFDWIEEPRSGAFDVISANLFLHHFSDARLRGLFAALRPLAPVFVAMEPSRNPTALTACSLLRLIGANKVTLHDASASIRAGFAGNELSSLWPSGFRHHCEEWRIGPFTHAFRVVGRPPQGFP